MATPEPEVGDISAQMDKPVTRQLVEKIYQKAITDGAEIISRMWPSAVEQKRSAVAELGFPTNSEEWLKNSTAALSEKQIKSIAATHRKAIKKHLPSLATYRPSELVIASLQAAWEPYAELLLRAAKSEPGGEFRQNQAGANQARV
jgi:hypothetical protein